MYRAEHTTAILHDLPPDVPANSLNVPKPRARRGGLRFTGNVDLLLKAGGSWPHAHNQRDGSPTLPVGGDERLRVQAVDQFIASCRLLTAGSRRDAKMNGTVEPAHDWP